jgi:predicted DNA-binding protein YlxM (UPF0122 family)
VDIAYKKVDICKPFIIDPLLSCVPDLKTTKEMYYLYCAGLSLAEVGKAFGVSRQTVYERFRKRSLPLRPRRKPLPFIVWKNKKYSRRPNGYFAETRCGRRYLHQDVWVASKGEIPKGMQIHHKDGDKENNNLENLELIEASEHGKRHGFGGNQYTGSFGFRPIR